MRRSGVRIPLAPPGTRPGTVRFRAFVVPGTRAAMGPSGARTLTRRCGPTGRLSTQACSCAADRSYQMTQPDRRRSSFSAPMIFNWSASGRLSNHARPSGRWDGGFSRSNPSLRQYFVTEGRQSGRSGGPSARESRQGGCDRALQGAGRCAGPVCMRSAKWSVRSLTATGHVLVLSVVPFADGSSPRSPAGFSPRQKALVSTSPTRKYGSSRVPVVVREGVEDLVRVLHVERSEEQLRDLHRGQLACGVACAMAPTILVARAWIWTP